ncbi:hypothetical protein NPIL_584591 [Nephila pilipes]|uniref:Uncharacterized protein n=1 Tax=Nephila pilipes TaxID=299642 RepID=A0A8X6UHW9_NEPPI|nr:hypothetical protein NPIL_584591 [Nephila pilipes]
MRLKVFNGTCLGALGKTVDFHLDYVKIYVIPINVFMDDASLLQILRSKGTTDAYVMKDILACDVKPEFKMNQVHSQSSNSNGQAVTGHEKHSTEQRGNKYQMEPIDINRVSTSFEIRF